MVLTIRAGGQVQSTGVVRGGQGFVVLYGGVFFNVFVSDTNVPLPFLYFLIYYYYNHQPLRCMADTNTIPVSGWRCLCGPCRWARCECAVEWRAADDRGTMTLRAVLTRTSILQAAPPPLDARCNWSTADRGSGSDSEIKIHSKYLQFFFFFFFLPPRKKQAMPGAVVTVQLGQCGNQVGQALFNSLYEHTGTTTDGALSASARSFFREARDGRIFARGLLLDMEPKVTGALLLAGAHTSMLGRGSKSASATPFSHSQQQQQQQQQQGAGPGWLYDARASLHRQGGSGNNWALGYAHHGLALADDIESLLRAEAERCDHGLSGLIFAMSLAGGTGSGLGTRATEVARDMFPGTTIAHHTVWPRDSGEVTVQSLNAVLTLGSLCSLSDAVFASSNDEIERVCRDGYGIPSPGMADLNGVIAAQLASVLLPASIRRCGGGGARWSVGDPLVDVVAHLCPSPAHRLVSLASTPQVPRGSLEFHSDTWHAIHARLGRMVAAGRATEGHRAASALLSSSSTAAVAAAAMTTSPPPGISSLSSNSPSARAVAGSSPLRVVSTSRHTVISAYYVSRGSEASAADTSALEDGAGLYVPWRARGEAVLVAAADCAGFGGVRRHATAAYNSSAVAAPLNALVGRASEMLQAGAYVHHYAKHGVGRDDFEDRIAILEQVLGEYVEE
jgi:tubulin delta